MNPTTCSRPAELNDLRSIHFLRDSPEATLQRLVEIAAVNEYPEQAVIVRQGEPARTIFLIISGQVAIEICAAGVGCKRILTVGGGGWLGWAALLEPSGWTATARAVVPTRVIVVDGEALRMLCEAEPRFGYEIMKRLAQALAARLNATRLQLLDVYGSMMPEITELSWGREAAAISEQEAS